MSREPVRIGVVGAGWFASRRHLPDIGRCAGAKLAAICRRSKTELRRIAEHFGSPPAYTDYAEMLAHAKTEGSDRACNEGAARGACRGTMKF